MKIEVEVVPLVVGEFWLKAGDYFKIVKKENGVKVAIKSEHELSDGIVDPFFRDDDGTRIVPEGAVFWGWLNPISRH